MLRNNTKEQKRALYNIETVYKARSRVIKLLDDHSSMVFETIYKTIHGERIKILTPKEMLQRLPIALAQLRTSNMSENLLTEIR